MRRTNIFSIQAVLVGMIMLISTLAMQAQVISRNDKGEVVVTYKDGSWRYFMSSDSILLVEEYQNFLKQERGIVEEVMPEPEELNAEIVEEDVSAKPDEIDNPLADEQMFTMDEQQILELTERRLTLTERLRRVESGYIELSEKEIRKVREELAELNRELNTLNGVEEKTTDIETVSTIYNRNDYEFSSRGDNKIKTPCKVEVERDEFSKRKIAKVEREFFYQYTPEEMHMHLKGQHYLDAYVSLTQTNGNIILTINTVINSKANQSGYGVLDKGSRLRIKFINGEVISLYNSVRDEGRKDMIQKKYFYTGRYVLDKDVIKALTKNDIDGVRVNWSTGYEDYDVYYVDVIRRQLECLNQAL